ncbi:protein of unknown function [Pararobbsia alpina]
MFNRMQCPQHRFNLRKNRGEFAQMRLEMVIESGFARIAIIYWVDSIIYLSIGNYSRYCCCA